MLSRPTTEQLLNDCAREVRESIMPLIDDPAVLVNLEMLEQVLTSCAVRAAHEIGWFDEEAADALEYARTVADRLGDARTQAELDAYEDGRSASLHLEQQAENYHLASEALAAAIEASAAAGDPELIAAGAALLRTRRDHEQLAIPGFDFPGRA